ncbi:MAG: restriction endonuclease subunit S, partial [Patescibacteria group bacterium]
LRVVADDLKKSGMHKLFTHGLRDEAQKVTDLGPVPESWEVVALGDVCSLSTGTTPATKRPDYYQGSIPFIKTSEIVNNRLTRASTFISQQAVADYNLRVYPPGTVLMAMYGQGKTRGQVALLELAAATTQNAAALQPLEGLDPGFLWQYLLNNYERLRGIGSLGHLSHLNLGYLREIAVVKPTITEQREIVSILEILDRKIDVHERKHAALIALFTTLLTRLMTGDIRVTELNINTTEVRIS